MGKAWVSGASSGLGAAFTAALLAEGIAVWGTSRSLDRLSRWADHPLFHAVVLDLNDTSASLAAYRQAEGEAEGFDLVIHNAGYGVFGPFDELPLEQWQQQLNAMLVSTVALNHASYTALRSRGAGALVNVSSLAVQYPLPYMAVYNVAKAGLSALSESLMFEAQGSGVRIIDFRPGDFRTDFNQAVRRPQESSDRTAGIWQVLERNLQAAPTADVAVRDLWKALHTGRSGTFTSGGFFQAKVARLFAALAPHGFKRAVADRYFKGNSRG